MNYSKLLALGATVGLLAGVPHAAMAADIIEPYVEPAPPPIVTGGWYLRGAIGMSNQKLGKLDYARFSDPTVTTEWLDKGGFASAPTFSLGAGYKFNDWFRADLTGQYRGGADFHALQRYAYVADPSSFGTDDYRARKSEWLFLANGYVDLGNYHGVMPYIGGGIGASRNTISGFNDVNVITSGGGYAGSASEWNFAWALHAGLGFKVTENMIFDVGYSYLNLGDARTGTAYNYDGSTINESFKFKNLTSHDVNLGLRYVFN